MGQTYQTVLCLAPMAGITDWPMRVLCYRMGADYACSEMVSAIGYLCAKPGNDAYRRLLAVHPEEDNTACQLFGKDPSVMGEAAAKVTALGRFRSLDIQHGLPGPQGGVLRRGKRASAGPGPRVPGDGGGQTQHRPARYRQNPPGIRCGQHERFGAGTRGAAAGPSVDRHSWPHAAAAVRRHGGLGGHPGS